MMAIYIPHYTTVFNSFGELQRYAWVLILLLQIRCTCSGNVRFETGSEVSVLILDPVKIVDSGNYTCSATNKDGSDKFVTLLSVKASPNWLEQPTDIVTFVGASIENRCIASGFPQPQITWKKITEAPKVKNFHFDDNIKEGDPASVICLATSTIKPVKFHWHKNNQPISSSNNNIRIDDGAIHSVLVFNSVTPSDDGNYTCIAVTSEGQDKFTAHLSVKDISEFINLKPIKGSEEEFDNGKLNLVDVSELDSGLYECIADNGIPPSIRSNFSIVIRASPKWIDQPSDIITTAGDTVVVRCIASGSPEPRILWKKKNGKPKVSELVLYL
ncbi:titin [Caerostris extrusa]|uniref:Titin n=1 Tax=Caerostris extrusa TaxID=172846 RepID=A0AAV4QG51_CAEEX|nr:titin [Caerostris extrusa]